MADQESRYDYFISAARADRDWVEGFLRDALTAAGVRTISEDDFAAGAPPLLSLQNAVLQSDRVLLVLSPAYQASNFGQVTQLLAQSYGEAMGTWPVIPLIRAPVSLQPLQALPKALDATDQAQWPSVIKHLCALTQHAAPGPPPAVPCPYPGMVPYGEADSGHFYGRKGQVEELVNLLSADPFRVIIGPSGGGKSSLVFAGLIPALRRSTLFGTGSWRVCKVPLGLSPFTALQRTLQSNLADPAHDVAAVLSTPPEARRLLLVFDQF
jgi:hypothetical protein